MSGYEKRVRFAFEIDGVEFEVSDISEDRQWIVVSETRKNGQEDCHMVGELHVSEENAVWFDSGERSFRDYGWPTLPEQILTYIAANGVPS